MPANAISPPSGRRDVRHRLPLWLKLAYTVFMAVLVPSYWIHYGPTNFLFFCDVALFLAFAGVWLESPLLVSIPALGVILPQVFWLADLAVVATGNHFLGWADYMFDSSRPFFLRSLSLFHGWLPLLLLFLVARLGYDPRALPVVILLTWAIMLVCYFFTPPPGDQLANGHAPVNINRVFGLANDAPQQWMHPLAWLAVLWFGLVALDFVPAHLLLKRFFKAPPTRPGSDP